MGWMEDPQRRGWQAHIKSTLWHGLGYHRSMARLKEIVVKRKKLLARKRW